MGLKEYTHVFTEEIPDDPNKIKVLISLSIPEHIIDEQAKELELDCTLRDNDVPCFIKQKFKLSHASDFTVFDATARHEAMDEFLQEEIDFKYYTMAGIIEDFQFMHTADNIKDIQESLHNYRYRLMFGFLSFSGKFLKYI